MRRQAKLRYRLTAMVLLLLAATLAAVTAITHGQSLSVIRRQAFALNSKLVDAGAERLETEYSQLNSLFSPYTSTRTSKSCSGTAAWERHTPTPH